MADAEESERFNPNPFPSGVALADAHSDGAICGSTMTWDGEPCELPANYGRHEVEDPTDTACVRHTGDEPKCGVETMLGGPCLLPAAFGREDAEEGPCVHHAEAARSDRRVVQAEFLVELAKSLTVTRAAERVGIGRSTVWLWAAQYPEFGRAIDKLQNGHVAAKRLQLAEDQLFERVADDRAGAAERVFFLVNMSAEGEGWRDVKLVKHEHNVSGGVLMAPGTPEELDDWGDRAEDEQKKLEADTGGREIETTAREHPSPKD